MRAMSFALTTRQIRDRTKIVTRRLGWLKLKPNVMLRAVEKAQGLKKGEYQVTLCLIRTISVLVEPLDLIQTQPEYGFQECIKEGFPELKPWEFVEMFCRTHKHCTPETDITRIEFTYVESANCVVVAA